jgi:pyridine nucleotide-disulfide oxidoreductase
MNERTMIQLNDVQRRYDQIAIIGGGPSATYFLRALAEAVYLRPQVRPARVVVIERTSQFGCGWVYSTKTVLGFHNLAANERVTRIDKGRQLADDFSRAVSALRRLDVGVDIAGGCEVVAAERTAAGFVLRTSDGHVLEAGHVLLATGHWARKEECLDLPDGVTSPWPADRLRNAVAAHREILLIGTSHTAVDAALSLAAARGHFESDPGGHMVFRGDRNFSLLMASRSGILPRVSGFGVTTGQGDPRGHLKYNRFLTEQYLQTAAAAGTLRLDHVLSLLFQEAPLSGAQDQQRLSGFAAGGAATLLAHLTRRLAAFGAEKLLRFDSVRADHSLRRRRHIPWQALLWEKTDFWRAYLQYLPGEDRALIDRHETLLLAFQRPLNGWNASRLLALHDAGVLTVKRLVAPPQSHRDGGFVTRFDDAPDSDVRFGAMVDCRGQVKSIEASDSPLLQQLLRDGLIQPTLIPFAAAPPHRTGKDAGYYRPGGIHLNPATLEAIPAGHCDNPYVGSGAGLFVLGPAMLGFYPISDGLHALHKVSQNAVTEILRRIEIDLRNDIAGLWDALAAGDIEGLSATQRHR